MRLRTKINLWLELLILVTVACVSIGVFFVQREEIANTIHEAQQTQARNWASVCEEALSTKNDLSLLNYIKVLKKSEGLLFAYLVRANGEIVIHTDTKWIFGSLTEWEKHKPAEEFREIRAPILNEGREVAAAVIGFSRTYEAQAIANATQKMLSRVLRISLGVFLFGIAFAYLLALALTKPVQALVKGSQEIGSGNFNTEVSASSNDELGDLAASFNKMARQLAQLDELKDEFIQSVSHDLRGPLAAIRMYSEHLLSEGRGTLNPRQKEMMNVISESSGRLGIFINTILDTAKIKAGKMTYHLKPVQLMDIARPVIELLQVTAQRNKLQLTALIPSDMPPLNLDAQRIEMAISNLLTNAMKFTPEGGKITLGVKNHDNGFVDFFIQDTGYGIPKEKLPHLFQRFQQINEVSQKENKISGTGLGLFLVKQTVEAHGGKVWAESEVGKGTTVHMTLPKVRL